MNATVNVMVITEAFVNVWVYVDDLTIIHRFYRSSACLTHAAISVPIRSAMFMGRVILYIPYTPVLSADQCITPFAREPVILRSI